MFLANGKLFNFTLKQQQQQQNSVTSKHRIIIVLPPFLPFDGCNKDEAKSL